MNKTALDIVATKINLTEQQAALVRRMLDASPADTAVEGRLTTLPISAMVTVNTPDRQTICAAMADLMAQRRMISEKREDRTIERSFTLLIEMDTSAEDEVSFLFNQTFLGLLHQTASDNAIPLY